MNHQYRLTTGLDPVCDYHECEQEAAYLWAGFSVDDHLMFRANYCNQHHQTHAKTETEMVYIGEIELQ